MHTLPNVRTYIYTYLQQTYMCMRIHTYICIHTYMYISTVYSYHTHIHILKTGRRRLSAASLRKALPGGGRGTLGGLPPDATAPALKKASKALRRPKRPSYQHGGPKAEDSSLLSSSRPFGGVSWATIVPDGPFDRPVIVPCWSGQDALA